MQHFSIKYGSRTIDYKLSYQNRKTLGIKVFPDSSVRVIAPIDSSLESIESKVRSKAKWILKQQNEFLSYHPLTPPRQYTNGETHLYLGRQYRLKLELGSRNVVKLYRGRLILTRKEKSDPDLILRKWYREKAQIHFSNSLNTVFPKFAKYGLQYPQLSIRSMPTRWGSCTPEGKIILNPDLMKAPKGSIEYVIIHELCHLIEHNHTTAFYLLQERIMPDWKKWKETLEYALV